MKNIALLTAIISASAFSSDYIVKVKSNYKNNINLKSMGNSKEIKVSFGEFHLFSTQDKSIVTSLQNNEAIEYIEPNYTYKALSAPSDIEFNKQWGLNNTGKNSSYWFFRGKKGVDVGALKAWGISKGTKQVKIAVIDTGVDYNHEDLKDNIMINDLELNGIEGVDDDGNGYVDDIYGYDFANNDASPMDGNGHGTHCAGVIGASHNSKGISGINAKVSILPIKFLTDRGSGTLEGAIKSIEYAITRKVDIMNNSWGGGPRSQALFDAIEAAKNSGILFVAAAGNENNDNDKKPAYPASYKLDNVISVGSIDGKGNKSRFSNFGTESVHIFAPGTRIYSTVQNNKYKNLSGTSMACPHVAGVAGLLLANEPNLTYKEIKDKMMSTSVQTGELTNLSQSGYVNIFNALTK